MRKGGSGVLGLLLTLLVVGIVGVVAYNAGVAAGVASAAAGGGGAGPAIVYPGYGGFGFGFGFVGIFFTILLIWLLVGAFTRGRGGWGGPPRGWDGRGWGGPPRDVPPMAEPMLESWHRRAHRDAAAADDSTEGPLGPSSSTV